MTINIQTNTTSRKIMKNRIISELRKKSLAIWLPHVDSEPQSHVSENMLTK